MKKFLKKPYFIFAALIAVFLTCFAIHSEVSASALKVKDGQKLCGTFTFNVSKSSDGVKKQDFQVCGIVDKRKNFKSSLELLNDNWNNSIAYVSINGNILNIYDSPMNQGAIIGSLGAVYIGDQKQFIPTVGQNFETYLKSIKTYLNSLKDRKYWHKISNTDSVSSKATFKNQIDWSKKDVTADDTNLVANNKAKCEAKGYTWKGNDAEGYECVDADGNVADASLSITGSTTYNPSTVNACYSNAGAVGWMLCPVIDGATAAANGMYQIIEESFLKIDVSDLFDDSNGVEQAWSAFRDIANIVFIVLFIVVILSQLTGFGIDNYGIKKILPRLIVVAVLINLSYIICQLAVDVSNIIGVSLREFLTGLVPQGDLGTNADGAQWTVTLAGGALALGGVTAATLLGGLGAIFAILGAIITAVVAIFFLWIILVIRSAGVVLLIAIAPLAIACYLLPNTEKLSKRWLDIFKALLILYPLSSLVIGAGALAGRILSFSNNEVMVLAAMIVQVVPFFFIPMLLRQSLAGLGNIGARLSNIGRTQGRNLSGRARQGLNNTNFAQNSRFNATQRRTGLRLGAANYANGQNGNRLTRGLARVVGGSQHTQARYIGQRKAMEEEELKNSRALAGEQMRNLIAQAPAGQALDKTYGDALQAAVDSGDKNRIMGMMSAIEQSNMSGSQKNKAIRQAFDRSGLTIGGDANTHADILRSVAQQHQGLMAADPELMRWANAGGMDNSGGKADLSGYAAANMSPGDVDDKDLDGITKAHLETLMQQGIITQNQAKRHWANGGGKGDTERLMFGAAGDGHRMTVSDAEAIIGLRKTSTNPNPSYTAADGHTYNIDDRDAYLKRNAQEVKIVP